MAPGACRLHFSVGRRPLSVAPFHSFTLKIKYRSPGRRSSPPPSNAACSRQKSMASDSQFGQITTSTHDDRRWTDNSFISLACHSTDRQYCLFTSMLLDGQTILVVYAMLTVQIRCPPPPMPAATMMLG